MSEHTLSPVPPTASDVEVLALRKGLFAQGHTDEDINEVLAEFTGARLVCVWDYHDEWGFGGNSEIVGRDTEGTGPWRRLSSEFTEFLYDPESDLAPETIASILDADGRFAVYEEQGIDALDGDERHNVTLDAQVAVPKQ